MKRYLFLTILSFQNYCFSQNVLNCESDAGFCNLINNGNFENYSSIPSDDSEIQKACGWNNGNTFGTSDYMHAMSPNSKVGVPCNEFGLQDDKINGNNGYAGFLSPKITSEQPPVYFENMYSRLGFPLKPNTKYRLTFDASLPEGYANHQSPVQVYFSKNFTPYLGYGPMSITNTNLLFSFFVNDYSTWTTYSKDFTTSNIAGEDTIIIGALSPHYGSYLGSAVNTSCLFRVDNINFAYTYIDNIKLVEIPQNLVVDDLIYCLNDPIRNFNITNKIPESYLRWYDNPSDMTPSATPPVYSTQTSGIHTFQVTQFFCGIETARTNAYVIIIERPTLNPISDYFVCTNNNITLNASSTDALSSIEWYTNSSFTGTPIFVGNNYTVTPTATTTYYVLAKNMFGCKSDIKPITVFVIDLSNITINSAASIICTGDSYTLSASSTDALSSIEWYTNSSCTGTPVFVGNNYTVTPTATTTYYVLAKNMFGCKSIIKSITINVNPLPTLVVSSTTICTGNIINLSTLITFYTIGSTIKWYQTSTSVTPLTSLFVLPTQTTTYWVEATNTLTGCKIKKSVTVNVSPIPKVYVTTISDIVPEDCKISFSNFYSNYSITKIGLTNMITSNGSTCSYTITPSTGIQWQSINQIWFNGTIPQVYQIVVTNAQGCVKVLTYNYTPRSTVVQPSINPNNTTLCASTNTINLTLNNLPLGCRVVWSGPNIISPVNSTTIMVAPTNSSIYTCRIYPSGGSNCFIDLNRTININLGCRTSDNNIDVYQENNNEKLFEIYPNPTYDSFSITNSNLIKHIEIYDVTGKLIKTFNTLNEDKSVDVTELKAGVYFIKVYDNEKNISTHKLIKK